jgi:hypothetical protein
VRRLAAGLAVLALVIAGGCSSDDEDGDGAAPSATTTTTSGAAVPQGGTGKVELAVTDVATGVDTVWAL